jgi:glutathione reductase (NADPH)
LGAHLLGAQAPEVSNLFAMAIKSGMTAKDIKKTIFAYPTDGLDITYMV